MVRRATKATTTKEKATQGKNPVVQNQVPQPPSNGAPAAPGSAPHQQNAQADRSPAQQGGEPMPPKADGIVSQDAAPAEQLGKKRVPFGTHTQKLELPPREGFHRHWFNDRPNRIAQAEAAAYSFVLDSAGKPTSRVVGTREGGGAMLAYAMEIPKEYFDEDFANSQKRDDAIEAEIRGGKVAAKPDSNRYVPTDGIKITQGR